jgi:hypothetical protein
MQRSEIEEMQALMSRWKEFSTDCEFRSEKHFLQCDHPKRYPRTFRTWCNIHTCPGGLNVEQHKKAGGIVFSPAECPHIG